MWLWDDWDVAAFINHHGAFEFNHHAAILLIASRFYFHNADIRPGFLFAFLQDLATRVDGVTFKKWGRQADFIPAEIGHGIL